MDNEAPGVIGKESIQFNSQDLDQEQNVSMNPMQLNTQNLHVHVTTEKIDYSGKINGITYLGKGNTIVQDAVIMLFFGHETIIPVYKTKSDSSGSFIIEELPPGYYTIAAKYGEYQTKTQYIKLLPGQNAYHAIIF